MRISFIVFSTGAAFAALAASCYSPALGPIGYYCHLAADGTSPDNPACPDGATCTAVAGSQPGEGRCVASVGSAGAGLIPKTGAPYTGNHNDPMLNDVSMCPDASLEPNDSDKTSVPAPTPTPDTATPKITKMSICPMGARPETGQHDVDYFKIDTTTFGSSQLTVMAEIFYDISYGDLDVGVFDASGRLLSADGSAITNGCTAASVGPGVYYIVVAGANNTDSNRYDIRIRTFTMPRQCPTPGEPLDMSL